MIMLILVFLACIGAATWGFFFVAGTLAQYTKNNLLLKIIAWLGFAIYLYIIFQIGTYFSAQF